MAYEVVARRWRPLTFDSVVGQRHVTATLAAAIERGRVAHAFLFTGIRGVGKTTVARLLARALNCTGRTGAEPCNDCPSCKQILAGASVDVLEIDGASNRGIDEVRALIDGAAYRPAGGKHRIYIIDEVHQLTREAFNALLKILEEPPSHVKFVLATTEAHKLPQTVLSRCQRYDFRRLTIDEIVDQLAHIAKKDELAVDADAIALIAREADGSMRDAQSLLEQVVAATGGKADAASVSGVLGIAGTDLLLRCVGAVIEREPARVVEVMAEIRRNGFDTERFLNEVLDVVRHVSIAQAAGAQALGGSVPEAVRTAAAGWKDLRHPLDLQRIFSSLLRTAEDLRRGAMPELVLEMGLLKASMLESVTSAAEVLERLERTGAGSGGGGGRDSGPRGRAAGGPAGRPASSAGGGSRYGSSAPSAGAPSRDERGADSAATRSLVERVERMGAAHADASSSAADSTESPDSPDSADDASLEPMLVREPLADGPGSAAAHWEAFLALVRDEAGFDLYVTLSNCEVVKLTAERIELRAMVDGFRRRLDSLETMSKLRELATSHFGRPCAVVMTGSASASASGASASDRASRSKAVGTPSAAGAGAPASKRKAAAGADANAGMQGAPPSETEGEHGIAHGDGDGGSDDGHGGASIDGPAETSSGAALSVHSIEAERRTRMEERALSDPLVRTALDVMGAKVGRISQLDD